MRSSLEHWVRSFVTDAPLVLSVVAPCVCDFVSLPANGITEYSRRTRRDISNIPKGITVTMAQGKKIAEPEANCLFVYLSYLGATPYHSPSAESWPAAL
jgi:hypothetical protein